MKVSRQQPGNQQISTNMYQRHPNTEKPADHHQEKLEGKAVRHRRHRPPKPATTHPRHTKHNRQLTADPVVRRSALDTPPARRTTMTSNFRQGGETEPAASDRHTRKKQERGIAGTTTWTTEGEGKEDH